MPEHDGFFIWNQISEKYSNFGEIAIHKKTGLFKIVWSILNRGCNFSRVEKKYVIRKIATNMATNKH
jgi:hypothetical protein